MDSTGRMNSTTAAAWLYSITAMAYVCEVVGGWITGSDVLEGFAEEMRLTLTQTVSERVDDHTRASIIHAVDQTVLPLELNRALVSRVEEHCFRRRPMLEWLIDITFNV